MTLYVKQRMILNEAIWIHSEQLLLLLKKKEVRQEIVSDLKYFETKMCFRRFQATLISLPNPDPSSQFTKTLYPVRKFTLLCRYFTLLKCWDRVG